MQSNVTRKDERGRALCGVLAMHRHAPAITYPRARGCKAATLPLSFKQLFGLRFLNLHEPAWPRHGGLKRTPRAASTQSWAKRESS